MATIREAQKQMTRRLLLEKGLELFEEKGYAATTVDDIAVAVGTTRATFYAHFPSKGQLMQALVLRSNELLTEADVPSLKSVVESGDRTGIRRWLTRKFDQWVEIRPYVTAAHQAAASEPEVQSALDRWFDAAIDNMQAGLDAADRFEASSRRVRCTLAFGELEFFSRRWMRLGWTVDRETSLDLMVDNWCFLLAE
ncbi:helix-turn-helix domain-containing protein [Pseudarthrobacter sulfonivorans]|uniref:TetR/AcrR family transcriptional regulator n=1 Tax=Pseudarthrobacter sulfonivorans TaxID=121292 RepID=UPI00285C38F0|nr:helix-turn-helix domain-containing protein [Pseudarthrobacter sulfonivorans]MDR6415181.1 AcrR family transcriptional regulator [Pseudarthrobacter sulfonivorans]